MDLACDCISIDWGDGNVEHIKSGELSEVFHDYNTTGLFFVNITGGLNFVTEYAFSWIDYNINNLQEIQSVDITQMKELQAFTLYWRIVPKQINFSQNIKLKYLTLGFTNLEELDISNNPQLIWLNVERSHLLSPDKPYDYSKIDKIVTDLTAHVTANNIRGGLFVWGGYRAGPIPEELLVKLANLEKNYGWDIESL